MKLLDVELAVHVTQVLEVILWVFVTGLSIHWCKEDLLDHAFVEAFHALEVLLNDFRRAENSILIPENVVLDAALGGGNAELDGHVRVASLIGVAARDSTGKRSACLAAVIAARGSKDCIAVRGAVIAVVGFVGDIAGIVAAGVAFALDGVLDEIYGLLDRLRRIISTVAVVDHSYELPIGDLDIVFGARLADHTVQLDKGGRHATSNGSASNGSETPGKSQTTW